jgi:hypothetical protein
MIKVESYHKPASFFILRNKRYFDFRLNLDLMSISENLLGVVFRFRDQFNYYAFLLNQKKGYKRLIKVSNGRYRKIAELRDGGLFLNDWFKVQIEVKTSNIRVRFGEDKNFMKYSELPIVFNVEDFELREGSVGLLVNNNNQFYFDKFDVKPRSCWTDWSGNNKIQIIPRRSSIYDEDYKRGIEEK